MSTYKNFIIETDADGIALVTWNMPDKSMNVFTVEVMDEIEAIVDATVADEAVKGVVFTSGKSTFSGGADLTMIKGMFAMLEAEKAKDPDSAVRKLFDAAAWFDKNVIDGAVNGVASIVSTSSGELSKTQTGRVRNYAIGIAGGAVAVLVFVIVRMSG